MLCQLSRFSQCLFGEISEEADGLECFSLIFLNTYQVPSKCFTRTLGLKMFGMDGLFHFIKLLPVCLFLAYLFSLSKGFTPFCMVCTSSERRTVFLTKRGQKGHLQNGLEQLLTLGHITTQSHWEELLKSVSDFIFSKHYGYRSRGLRGVKRSEKL